MSWSYSPEGPFSETTAAGRRNRIRRLIADTDQRRHLVEDEELDDILAMNANAIFPSAIDAVDQLLARFAPRADSDGTTNYTGVTDRLRETRRRLLLRAGARPFLGGGSVDDIESRDEDDDVPPWRFDETGPGDLATSEELNPLRRQ